MLLIVFMMVPIMAASLDEDDNGRESAIVNKVLTGDSIEVTMSNEKYIVRLIGVDCAEVRMNKHILRQAQITGLTTGSLMAKGRKAKYYMESLLPPGTNIGLEYDILYKDRKGRLLAYVWNGEVLTNRDIVARNYCWSQKVPPNIKRQTYIKSGRESPFSTNRIIYNED